MFTEQNLWQGNKDGKQNRVRGESRRVMPLEGRIPAASIKSDLVFAIKSEWKNTHLSKRTEKNIWIKRLKANILQ